MDQQVKPELEAIIRAQDSDEICRTLEQLEPADVGALLGALSGPDAFTAFRSLPPKSAAAVFKYLSRDHQEALIESLASDGVHLAALLNELSPDDRTAFFAGLPNADVRQYLSILEPEERKSAVRLLGYPAGSIGRLATTDYVALHSDWSVDQALRHIRRYGKDSETINVIYIVDQNWKLVDDLRLREILLADPEANILSLMDQRFVALSATDEQEKAVKVFREYDRAALPVVDAEDVLVGIVTVDDILDVAEEEATEDMQKVGGLEQLDFPYMQTSLGGLIMKRAPWLAILFIGEMFTASAMGHFESVLEKAVVLALFIPLVISSGGNSGSQAATIIIRALATGEVKLRDWWRVIRREVLSGLILGTILGILGILRVTIWGTAFGSYGEHWLVLGLTIALSLVGVVTWGTITGSMLPFIINRLGGDPAVSSTPFVATLVDVTGLVIYFSIATLMLSGTLL